MLDLYDKHRLGGKAAGSNETSIRKAGDGKFNIPSSYSVGD